MAGEYDFMAHLASWTSSAARVSLRVFANFATSARAMRRKRDDGGGGAGSADHRAFTPLSLLMESSILIPLRAQLAVVNSAVVNYLLVGAKLNDHFKALRNYLLFHDGEFAQHLSTALFNEVGQNSFINIRIDYNYLLLFVFKV